MQLRGFRQGNLANAVFLQELDRRLAQPHRAEAELAAVVEDQRLRLVVIGLRFPDDPLDALPRHADLRAAGPIGPAKRRVRLDQQAGRLPIQSRLDRPAKAGDPARQPIAAHQLHHRLRRGTPGAAACCRSASGRAGWVQQRPAGQRRRGAGLVPRPYLVGGRLAPIHPSGRVPQDGEHGLVDQGGEPAGLRLVL